MSILPITSVQNQPLPQVNDLDSQLKSALGKGKLEECKELVRQGANPNIAVNIEPRVMLKMVIKSNLVFEPGEVEEAVSFEECEGISGSVQCIMRDTYAICQETFDSEKLLQLASNDIILDIAADLVLAYLKTEEGFNEEYRALCFEDSGAPTGLFELVASFGDLEFLDLMFEKGATFNPRLWEEGSFFDVTGTEEQQIEKIQNVMSRGYSLEDLFTYEETFEELLEDCIELEEFKLAAFLEENRPQLDITDQMLQV